MLSCCAIVFYLLSFPELVQTMDVDRRVVVQVFGVDGLGRDVVRGYGMMHIPTSPGTYTRTVRMFAPLGSSWMSEMMAWLTGSRPEVSAC